MSRAFVSGHATKVLTHLFLLGEDKRYCGSEAGYRMTASYQQSREPNAACGVWFSHSEVCSPFTEVYLLLVSPPVDEITEA